MKTRRDLATNVTNRALAVQIMYYELENRLSANCKPITSSDVGREIFMVQILPQRAGKLLKISWYNGFMKYSDRGKYNFKPLSLPPFLNQPDFFCVMRMGRFGLFIKNNFLSGKLCVCNL